VSHTAVTMSRTASGWTGDEGDLREVEDLDTLADDLHVEAGTLSIVFIEEDDEWLGIVRVTDDLDPRVFLSDRRVLETSDLAQRLFADALPVLPPADTDDDDDTPRPAAEAVGDTDLLADLGTPGDVLIELCAEEGLLPGDVVSALCERAGCLDVLDEIRVA
jgi:putative tRNA adenosine deaminase-associated protein